jgi:hypothetical protein
MATCESSQFSSRVVNLGPLPIRLHERSTTQSWERLDYAATANDSGRMVGNSETIPATCNSSSDVGG